MKDCLEAKNFPVWSESESRSVMSDSLWPNGPQAARLLSPWNSPGQNPGGGSLSLIQGIFPTKGLNPGLLHCWWILYQLSHQGSPRRLEWVAYPFSSGSSQTRELNQGHLYCRQILYQLSYEGSLLFLNDREESIEEKFDERTRTFLFVRFNFRQKQDWYFRLI